MNYDKAIEIHVNTEVSDHFSDKELKAMVKVNLVNTLIQNGLTVDGATRYQISIIRLEDGVCKLQARAMRGDVNAIEEGYEQ